MQKVIINSNELIVLELYPYRYDFGRGKEVLRIKIAETDHTFEDIKVLDNRSKEKCPVIEHWQDDELKVEYQGYNADFSVNYLVENDINIFSIEITRQGSTEVKLSVVENDVVATNMTVADLSLTVSALIFGGEEV